MRRLARRLLYIAILIVVAIIIALFWRAGPLRQQLRKSIAEQLSRQLDRSVSIGSVGLGVTGRAVAHDIVVRNKDGSVLVSAPEASVRLGHPLSLLSPSRAAAAISAITLTHPEITLIREASRKWNIEDLLRRRPSAPSRFTGDIVIDRGELTVIDRSVGRTTKITDLNLDVRQPAPGRVTFSISARGAGNSFDSFDASGESDSTAKTADISAKISDLDVGYAFARLPKVNGLSLNAGRANATATIKITPETPPKLGAGMTVDADVENVEMSFPWLKQPIKSIKSKLHFSDGDLRFGKSTGTLAGAPVEGSGTLTDIQHPQLNMDFRTWDIRYKQLQDLMPRFLAPTTLLLPSPLTVDAHVGGTPADPQITGSAKVKVIKFHFVPWHDAVADFHLTKGKLRIENLHAHGSPRQVEANITIQWAKGLKTLTTANFTLTAVPVRDFAAMIGLQNVPLEGIASFTGKASLDSGQTVTGKFTIKNAVLRGVRLGEVSGDLAYANRTAIVRNGRIKGPIGEGDFSATIRIPDRYEFKTNLSNFDLSALGSLFGQPKLKGAFPATARASGDLRGTHSSGAVSIGPGQIQGRAFEFVESDFDYTPDSLRLTRISGKLAKGTFQGDFQLAGWQRLGERASILGKVAFDGISPADWLPTQYALVVSGLVGGVADLSGTIAAPEVGLDLKLASVTAANMSFPSGEIRVRYRAGQFTIEQVSVQEAITGLHIATETTPTGLAYVVTGDKVDVSKFAAGLRLRFGLDITGAARVRAIVSGKLTRPQIDFDLSADEISVNDLPFTDIVVSGHFVDGVLQIEPPPLGRPTLRQLDSSVTITGSVAVLPPGPTDLTAVFNDVDMLTAQSIVDRAEWHLSQRGTAIPVATPYFALPRPFGGRLNGAVRMTGSLTEPVVEVPWFRMADLTFGNHAAEGRAAQIAEIKGSVTAAMRIEGQHMAALRMLRMDVSASEGDTYAHVKGSIDVGGPMSVSAVAGNIDLGLLAPWLQYTVNLDGLALGGIASIDLEIGGTTVQPRLEGSLNADDFSFGPIPFENLRAFDISLSEDILTIGSIQARRLSPISPGTVGVAGPRPLGVLSADLRGSARIPLTGGLDRLSADIELSKGYLAPIAAMTPIDFDGNLYLRGNTLYLSKEPPEKGPPSNGLRDSAGAGKLSAQGTVEFAPANPGQSRNDRFAITVNLNQLPLDIKDMVKGNLTGTLQAVNAPDTGRLVLATPSLATVAAVAAEPTAPPPSPQVSVHQTAVPVSEVIAELGQKLHTTIEVIGEVKGVVTINRDFASVNRVLMDIRDQTGIFWWRDERGAYHVSTLPRVPPPVTVRLHDVPVSEVVAALEEQARVKITTVGEIDARVSVSRDQATVDRVLEDVYGTANVFWWRDDTGAYFVSAAPPPENRPIVLSQAQLFVPKALPSEQAPIGFPIDLRVKLVLGENVEFRYGSGPRPTRVQIEPGGYVYVGGRPTASDIILDGEARAHQGTLSFPTGALNLRRAEARITLTEQQAAVAVPTGRVSRRGFLAVRPQRGWPELQEQAKVSRPPHVWISAEADGHIGQYYVSLSPIGQVYPPLPGDQRGYTLNAVSIPPLDETYVLALLAGTVIVPNTGGEIRDLTRVLSSPGSVGLPAGELTGFQLPPFGGGSPAAPALALNLGFQGPVQLSVGEHIFPHVLVSMLSPLSGPQTRTLSVTYEIAPRWSVGWGSSPLDSVRWEVLGLFPF